jgi:hypothetical protein
LKIRVLLLSQIEARLKRVEMRTVSEDKISALRSISPIVREIATALQEEEFFSRESTKESGRSAGGFRILQSLKN